MDTSRARRRPEAADVSISAADIRFPPLTRVGYVRGAADLVPEALTAVGVPIEILGERDLVAGDLSRYDAILVGSRAYETDAALPDANGRLLDYARAGGLVIVQYQQYDFIRGSYAPFPLDIARPHDRVTDETAKVAILDPQSPVFRTPNAIGPADWEGWVQERGLYFAHTWAPEYQPLLSMADPGGPEQKGCAARRPAGKGALRLHGAGVLPPAAGRRAGGLSPARQPSRAEVRHHSPKGAPTVKRVLLAVCALVAGTGAAFAQFEGTADFKVTTVTGKGEVVPGTGKMFLTKSAYRMEWETDISKIARGRERPGFGHAPARQDDDLRKGLGPRQALPDRRRQQDLLGLGRQENAHGGEQRPQDDLHGHAVSGRTRSPASRASVRS